MKMRNGSQRRPIMYSMRATAVALFFGSMSALVGLGAARDAEPEP